MLAYYLPLNLCPQGLVSDTNDLLLHLLYFCATDRWATFCRDDCILTSPLCHESVDIHEGCEQLERHLEPRLLPARIEDLSFWYRQQVCWHVCKGRCQSHLLCLNFHLKMMDGKKRTSSKPQTCRSRSLRHPGEPCRKAAYHLVRKIKRNIFQI